MKFATLILDGQDAASIKTDQGYIVVNRINQHFGLNWPEDLFTIITKDYLDEIRDWFDQLEQETITELKELVLPVDKVQFAPLYRRPRKIWGIGLNYRKHAEDLSEKLPTKEPASFMKPDTAIIGFNDQVKIPHLSQRTTGEAELGLIFGKECRNVPEQDWRSVIAGFTSILDMTAEDILERNPRNLTQSKSFDTFFSFGPIFYSRDEVEDLSSLQVKTILNDQVMAENKIVNMTFSPAELVSYHTRIMTMLPGDIISTGTPGAVKLSHGDILECRISGFQPLINQVIDLNVDRKDR